MKWFWKGFLLLLLLAAVADGIRYLQPDAKRKQTVLLVRPTAPAKITNLVFVYNANGGIYPGIADFIHKEAAPSSYPCNLCYQTFGTFGMKDEWKAYLDGLAYQKTFLHKDAFKRSYLPKDLPLPCVLASDGDNVWQLLSAAEINTAKSLQDIISLLNKKFTP